MSGVVLDTSVSLANALKETHESERVEQAFETARTLGGLVPIMWHYETRNVLLKSERQNRITRDGADFWIAMLMELPLVTDTSPDLDVVMTLARRHRMTFYDALFVELALRLDARLATLDGAMARAARSEGVTVS